jgi:hypothetical protein
VQSRLRELNDLGFDAEEVEIREDRDGWRLRPMAVEEGHHHRRLLRLVGIAAHENQARRILDDINGYATWLSASLGRPLPEAIAAYRWLTERWEPVIAQLPTDGDVEPTQFFHEVLDHCWFLSEAAGHDVGLEIAAASYLRGGDIST